MKWNKNVLSYLSRSMLECCSNRSFDYLAALLSKQRILQLYGNVEIHQNNILTFFFSKGHRFFNMLFSELLNKKSFFSGKGIDFLISAPLELASALQAKTQNKLF